MIRSAASDHLDCNPSSLEMKPTKKAKNKSYKKKRNKKLEKSNGSKIS